MAQKLSDLQNKTYAKLGIRHVVVIRELNGTKDTIAIRKYNSDGFLVERDTFVGGNPLIKQERKWLYEYSLKEKQVKVASQDIEYSPEPLIYQTQEFINYYDNKDRLIKNEIYDRNDTSVNYFEVDSNGLTKNFKNYINHKKILFCELRIEYQLDGRGRLISFTTNYRDYVDPTKYATSGNSQGIPPRYYERNSNTSQLVYNNKEHSIRLTSGEACYETYYIKKKRQISLDHCCPETKHGLIDGYYSKLIKTTTTLDNHSRIKNVSFKQLRDKNSCGKYGSAFMIKKYKYNKSGLLSEVIFRDTKEKIFFHYLN